MLRTAPSACTRQIGSDQRTDLGVDQRPERIAAQAGQRTEGDAYRTAFAAQQPGANARDAVAATALYEAVNRVVGRERQGDMAERDDAGWPRKTRFVLCHRAIGSETAYAEPEALGGGIADDLEFVATFPLQQALDHGAGLRPLHAGQFLVAIDIEQDQPVPGAIEMGIEPVGDTGRTDGRIDD